MMRKKTTFGFALTCVLIAAALAFTAGFLIAGKKVKDVTETNEAIGAGNEMISEVSAIIKDNYLGTINQNDLTAGMCKGYVEGLGDGAVKYLTAAEYADYNKGTPGETIIYKNFGKGIGYMKFLGFSDSTKTSFTNALNDFSKSTVAKVNMLVLDLRNCSSNDIQQHFGCCRDNGFNSQRIRQGYHCRYDDKGRLRKSRGVSSLKRRLCSSPQHVLCYKGTAVVFKHRRCSL